MPASPKIPWDFAMKPQCFALPVLAVLFLMGGLWLLAPSERAASRTPTPIAELLSDARGRGPSPLPIEPLKPAARGSPPQMPEVVATSPPVAVTVQREVSSCKQAYQAYTISEPYIGEGKV